MKKSDSKPAEKVDPFLKKFLGAEYRHVPFEKLSVSTATVDVRLIDKANLRYVELFERLPIDEHSTKTDKRPAGVIFGGRCGNKTRGHPPTTAKTSLKNSMMLWMWLEDKTVNLKVSRSGVHITGCKTADHAAETIRLLQGYIEVLHTEVNPLYDVYPYAVDFVIHMINYNFTIGVAVDLTRFDLFLNQKYTDQLYSPYNPNLTATNMSICCPSMNITWALNDNGQTSMCVTGGDFEHASDRVCRGYTFFYSILQAYRDADQ
jgi:hypothetical protein